MKTDDLVALLSTYPEPVDRGLVVRTLLIALGAGSILALGITIFGLGVRPDMMTSGALGFVVAKVSFAVAISSLALVYLAKLARPGGERKPRSYLVAVPFLVIMALAAISLALQLPFCFEVRTLSGGLVSSAPARPCNDVCGLYPLSSEPDGDATDFLD